MEGKTFRFRKDPDGVGILMIDTPEEKINKLSRALFGEIEEVLQQIGTHEDLKGVVLLSGKEDNFIAGADMDDFLAFRSPEDAESLSRRGQEILGHLESLPFPTVAAIHGACLGGGLETALACGYRIASDSARTILGQPEVQLGLVPGGGATQRLPRLIGLAAALDVILTGRNVRPRAALRMGLVDEVVPRESLMVAARQAVLNLAAGRLRPKRPGIRRLSDMMQVGTWKWLLTDGNLLGRAIICRAAEKEILRKTRGLYPAPLKALECVQMGLARGVQRGYELESRLFAHLTTTETCRQLIGIFFAVNAAKKDPGVANRHVYARPIEYVGILGAGFMGSGIAAVTANAGLRVRLKDQTFPALGNGLRFCHEFFKEKERRRTITPLELQVKLDALSGGIDYSGFARADLVIEAVFEDLSLKQRVLREVEERMHPDAIFGSNTSAIPIGLIAEVSRKPENVLGLHFFSPATKMPLLEIIITPRTSPDTVATAVALAKRIDKTPIVVQDGAGFYTSRILAPYVNEAFCLLEEGASVEDVDSAMVSFGYPVGPLALLDEVGLDVSGKVGHVLEEAFGARLKPPASANKLVEAGRLGRKNGRGFYQYDGKRKKVDDSIYNLFSASRRRKSIAREETQTRLALAMVNEAALCLQERILRSPRDGDLGAVLGLGFPPFLGGPFRFVDSHGAGKIVDELDRLSERFPLRFRPAPLLADMAKHSKKFYP